MSSAKPAPGWCLPLARLLPPEEYARVRDERRARMGELRRRRRVLAGRHVSLLFECAETVLDQIQEVLWIERPSRPERIDEELAEYAPLVPGPGEITATLMIHDGPPGASRQLAEGLAAGASLLSLRLGERSVGAELLRGGDAACPVQYLRFPLGRAAADALLRGGEVSLYLDYAGERTVTPIPGDTRDELAADLRRERMGA